MMKATVITTHWGVRHSKNNVRGLRGGVWYTPHTNHGERVIRDIHTRFDSFDHRVASFGMARVDGEDRIVQQVNHKQWTVCKDHGDWRETR